MSRGQNVKIELVSYKKCKNCPSTKQNLLKTTLFAKYARKIKSLYKYGMRVQLNRYI